MAALAHVKHFLNEEGIQIFPNWFAQAGDILKQQPGFISLKYAFDPQIKFCVNVWVEFSDMEKLAIWSNAEMHGQIIKAIGPYCSRPYQASRYEIQQTIDLSSKTDWARVNDLTDDTIDYSDSPEVSEKFFKIMTKRESEKH